MAKKYQPQYKKAADTTEPTAEPKKETIVIKDNEYYDVIVNSPYRTNAKVKMIGIRVKNLISKGWVKLC